MQPLSKEFRRWAYQMCDRQFLRMVTFLRSAPTVNEETPSQRGLTMEMLSHWQRYGWPYPAVEEERRLAERAGWWQRRFVLQVAYDSLPGHYAEAFRRRVEERDWWPQPRTRKQRFWDGVKDLLYRILHHGRKRPYNSKLLAQDRLDRELEASRRSLDELLDKEPTDQT